MRRSNFLLPVFLLLITVGLSGTASAQSSNRDHPTPLSSDEIKGELKGEEVEYFFSFTAGPGEVTFTVDVKSSDGTTSFGRFLIPGAGILFRHFTRRRIWDSREH